MSDIQLCSETSIRQIPCECENHLPKHLPKQSTVLNPKKSNNVRRNLSYRDAASSNLHTIQETNENSLKRKNTTLDMDELKPKKTKHTLGTVALSNVNWADVPSDNGH